MTRYLPLLLLLQVLLACSPKIDYSGIAYMPTQKVDIYLDNSAVPKNSTVIGKGSFKNRRLVELEYLQAKAVAKAKEKGADAILITDYFVPKAHSGIDGRFRRDTVNGSEKNAVNNGVQARLAREVTILFLKYR